MSTSWAGYNKVTIHQAQTAIIIGQGYPRDSTVIWILWPLESKAVVCTVRRRKYDVDLQEKEQRTLAVPRELMPNVFSPFQKTLHMIFSTGITWTLMLMFNWPRAQWVMLLTIPSVPLQKQHTLVWLYCTDATSLFAAVFSLKSRGVNCISFSQYLFTPKKSHLCNLYKIMTAHTKRNNTSTT